MSCLGHPGDTDTLSWARHPAIRRKGSGCTRNSPETRSGKPMISLQVPRSGRRAPSERDRPRQVRSACGSRPLRSERWTAARFYRRARVTVARAFRSASTKKGSAASAASRSPNCTPARNSSRRQSAAVVADDSHKSEAVEGIRFMNYSSRKYR